MRALCDMPLNAGTQRNRLREQAALLDKRVSERTAELQAANRALQQSQRQVREALKGEQRARLVAEESERRFRNMTEAIPHIVWTATAPQRFDYLSSRWRDLTGLAPEVGLNESWLDQVHSADVERTGEAWDAGAVARKAFEIGRLKARDGSYRWQLLRGVPYVVNDGPALQWYGTFGDIEDRKRAEELVLQKQKLESIGLLAAGVAHDFNNLLVGVVGNASLAQEMLPPDHPVNELVQGVIKAGEQAAHLTRQMLAYSGKGRFLMEPLNLSGMIPEMLNLVRPSISKKIALHMDLDRALPFVEADRGQVQQVFMNLALDAAEAIGSHDGVITVRAGVQIVDDRYASLNPEAAEMRPGEYVFLEVHDTGCGMDGAVKARIFDPFFSTKFTGRELGLAAVAGIVRGHKGSIIVTSAPGKGSSFTVLFTSAAASAEQLPVPAPRAALQGSGVILVVDDEAVVREMAKKALEHYGYTVLLADSGFAAIELCRRQSTDIALVVLDLSMPNMSGEEALPELRKIRPKAKVVISSGYSEAETMTLFRGQQVSAFIQKPYTPRGIAEKVKLALG